DGRGAGHHPRLSCEADLGHAIRGLPGDPHRIFGAHAAHLRVQHLCCSLTHPQRVRCAARCFTRIWTTWPPNLSTGPPGMPLDPTPVPDELRGLRVALLVSGGIAAYKMVDLASALSQAGCQVRVAMTASATRFVGPPSFQ